MTWVILSLYIHILQRELKLTKDTYQGDIVLDIFRVYCFFRFLTSFSIEVFSLLLHFKILTISFIKSIFLLGF